MTATVLPAVLVDLTNNVRASNNERILTRSDVLDTAARLKAEDMARNGYFAHTSPAGLSPWHWFNEAGYSFKYAGENLAIDFSESVDVQNAWLNSPTHKANILGSRFTEIGIATVDGMYQGHATTYVVEMFGMPAASPIAKAKSPTPAKVETGMQAGPVPLTEAPITVRTAPAVEGESIALPPEQNLETVTETKEFVEVKNNATQEKVETPIIQEVHYSKWYEKFMFLTPAYANLIYKICMWVVLVALLLMIIIEFRRQHLRNIFYGVLLLVIMFSFVYINKALFINSFSSEPIINFI